MPTLFDSHEEFNEWFSKDIESHAENKSAIDESKYCMGNLCTLGKNCSLCTGDHNGHNKYCIIAQLFHNSRIWLSFILWHFGLFLYKLGG